MQARDLRGDQLVAALILIGVLCFVLPPAAAWSVNRSRVRVASAEVAALADLMRQAGPELREAATRADVLSGPGHMPVASAPDAERWVTAPRGPLARAIGGRRTLSVDPWGNSYVVKLAPIAAGEPSTPWVLSAGPNGIIETPFLPRGDQGLAGDDVGARIRQSQAVP